jgi:hypothetical protein
MRVFVCPACERLVTFESLRCLNCGTALGFEFAGREMAAVSEPGAETGLVRCADAVIAGCNWATREGGLCASCSVTRTRPRDGDETGLDGFAEAEVAKRRLIFELAELGLPIVGWRDRRDGGLAFDLLSSEREAVTTGHADGVITLDLDETDPAHREQMRVRMGEPYRTVLGHFRHEIGHYYQSILMREGSQHQSRCREIFGDERADYQQAMDLYYERGAPAEWKQRYVSAYATMHPWEDFAETFAHYLHIRDAVQTAAAYGVEVAGPSIVTSDPAPLHADAEKAGTDFRRILNAWIPLTYALNAISRSMGTPDLYPFVLSPEIEAKLAFVDALVQVAPGVGSAGCH